MKHATTAEAIEALDDAAGEVRLLIVLWLIDLAVRLVPLRHPQAKPAIKALQSAAKAAGA